jgi:hydrogenase maturation protease
MQSIETDPPVLVIGYGNVLRGDDGAGPAAAEALRDQLPERKVEVLAVHQLLPELVQRLSVSRLAIFIDADWKIPPGQVHKRTLAAHHSERETIGHHQSPENLLEMTSELYGHAPPAILFTVGGANFGFQEGLSKPVRRAIPELVREVTDAVKQATDAERHHA